MKNIAVSVIIPVYNVEQYLEECLDSVISQDMIEIELICVNDGSTDNSLVILNKYAQKDKRIKIINQENQGLSCARNVGIDNASGEYILFLDSDDCLADNSLKEMYMTARKEKLEILVFDAECFYETEILRKVNFKDEYYRRKKAYSKVQTGKELFCELIENNDFCDSACLLFIQNLWIREEGIRFIPGIIHEDCLFSFQCYTRVRKISHVNKQYLRYRIRCNSIMTSKPSLASLSGRLECYKWVFGYLMSNSLSERMENAVAKFAEFIMYNIKYMDLVLEYNKAEHKEIYSASERLLMNIFGIGKSGPYTFNMQIYEMGFDTLVGGYDKVILYGAGKIGRKVFNYFKHKDMLEKIVGFAVSDEPTDVVDIEGIPIKKIDKFKNDGRILILITARWDYQDEMMENARKAGFGRVVAVDFQLEQCINCSVIGEIADEY